MMDKNRFETLIHGKAVTIEYRRAVREASNLELKKACSFMYGKKGCKGRYNACDAELRTRGVKWE